MTRSTSFRPDIQGLRGLAVLLVVVFHAWPQLLPGGYVGVDVFFVISGYLITGLLLRELDGTGRIAFLDFYARRIRRLLPAAALVIAGTVLVTALLRPPLHADDLAHSAIAAATYVSNLWFAAQAVDYLQQGLHTDPLLHTWSLGVEEQFYIVWPALLAASAALAGGRGSRRAIGIAVIGVSALSLAGSLILTPLLASWAFFGLPTRAWELGLGALVALAGGRAESWGAGTRRVVVGSGLLCILIAAVFFSSRTSFPGYAALLPAGGSFLVILAGAGDGDEQRHGLLRWAALQRIGDLSYSLYLWHWPVLILAAEAWPERAPNLVAAAGVLGSLALAALTYRFVENPVREHAGLRARPTLTVLAGLLLVGATVGIALASRHVAGGTFGVGAAGKAEQAARDRPRLYDDRCFASALEIEPPECLYGVAGARHTVALVGDSHAAQWFPALERLAEKNRWRLVVFVKAACPLAAVEPFDRKLNRPYFECTQWRDKVMARLAELRPTVLIGSHSSFYEPFVTRDGPAIAQWQRSLEESLLRIRTVAGHVVLIRDTPRPGFHVPGCLARAQMRRTDPAGACIYWLHEAVLPDAHETERTAALRTGASIVDLNAEICSEKTCPVERGGLVLFHDGEHLSAGFARSLAESLWNSLPAGARAALQE